MAKTKHARPGPATVDKVASSEPEVTTFGIYKVEGGLWRLRRLKTKGGRVTEILDNEPDILNIQVGKLNNEIEGLVT